MSTKAYHYDSEVEADLARSFNRLRFRLANEIEVLGLPDRQTDAFVALMKTLTYSAEEELKKAIRTQHTDNDNSNGKAAVYG